MIIIDINNGGFITLNQDARDKEIEVFSTNTGTFYILPGDFVTMLNWYRYQKEIGNIDLNF